MEERELHLRDYLRVVYKRRYTAVTFFAVVFVIAVVMTFSSTPVYVATTKVLIEQNEPVNLAPANFYYAPYDPDFAETQYQLIKSEAVAKRVVSLLSLDNTYDTYFRNDRGASGTGSIITKWFGMSTPGEKPQAAHDPKKAESIARMISGSITVTPVKNSKIVEISYMSTNPEFALLIANTVAKAYMDTNLEIQMSSSRYAMQWMQDKAEEEKKNLEQSEQAVQDYMKNKDLVTVENKVAMVPEELSTASSKLAEAESRRKEMEVLYNQVKTVAQHPEQADTIAVISNDPTIQALRAQILNDEQNITNLAKKFGPKHPTMIAAQGDLRALKDRKNQEVQRVVESVKKNYELSRSLEENFRQLAGQAKAATQNVNEKFIQYSVLKREAETNRDLYDAMVKHMKEQGISQDVQTVKVFVVEQAKRPTSPAKPNKTMNVLMGLVIGLAGGIGMAFFLEYLDNTIKSPEDVEERLGVPVFGIVPLMRSKEKSMDDIVLTEPQSAFAESYKIIRTSILLSQSAKPPKNLLVTSIFQGDGKTVTSVNLARTIAQSENSVLLIDSDLRKPRVHKVFGIDASKGLSTYLAGASDIDDIFHKVGDNLTVVPAGPIPPNPSELLGSSMMRKLLAAIDERFDIVVWDSAPLLTVTDSLILSKILDGTIIVTKAGATTYEGVRKALKSLGDLEAPFLGIVINALNVNKSDYYYQRYYSYGYPSQQESGQHES
jgi:succinoglycan biosynthesis transport protein ExoP